ncbi:MAG: tRNA pseudouridine(55) synthase TruB [Phycisphaeraceae bacterium]|nr:tRNA pseudouridine(55) synthase TruB [Phycisphaeraceae bacterium]
MTDSHKPAEPLNGLLVVDKPLGWSSMDVIRHVRRAVSMKRVGHAGTLDPLATGVVIVCIGKATRCVESLMGMTKVYEADVDLSAFTATDDREGEREEVTVVITPSREDLCKVLVKFVGQIAQTPPAFSAVHINGQRAYKLARRGESVALTPRMVNIAAIDLLDYAWPTARIRVTCGKGTYIRSLARDIGRALGTGGHLASLRRLSVGPYDLSQAVNQKRLELPIRQDELLPAPTPIK